LALRRIQALSAAVLACGALCAATPAAAADPCSDPNVLGTSRTLVVDPTEHPLVGTMQYRETLPLADHEVVLSFDDGPLPPNTGRILDTLASQCVKANYFMIGKMAKAYPKWAQRVAAAGHTIGTHSEDHPLTFNRMPLAHAEWEINQGIADVKAAIGREPAPFFRIPGLMRVKRVEDYLASQHIMTWSADFPADDWKHISASEVLKRALTRLEAHHKGILLLHDIHPNTAQMLPILLKQLKLRGYHIVHVVPAGPGLPKTPTVPSEWLMHPPVTGARAPQQPVATAVAAVPAAVTPAAAIPVAQVPFAAVPLASMRIAMPGTAAAH
jgi:peptidoglycan/xylan/chitin deacetylase (PgdA/CDA1 family)